MKNIVLASLHFFIQQCENKLKIINELSIPINIEFKNINPNNLKIYWNINDFNNENNQLKFEVEMKEEDKNEKFKKVYEGNNTNYLINNLLPYTSYEFRIRLISNEKYSNWTEIQKVKTSLDSNILHDNPKQNEFINKILEWTNFKKIDLLYRGTRDGTQPSKFHELCDNKGPTITLFKNKKGNVFGGYASISWKNNGGYQSAPDSFIFTLTNIHNTEPIKFPSNNDKREVNHSNQYGPWFGGGRDIGIDGDFLKKNYIQIFLILI